MSEQQSNLKVTMVAKGKIINPDGTEREIELVAEKILTKEEYENGDNTISSS